MQAKKIFKVPGGEAFIEVGESYIRLGVGNSVFFTLDEKTINSKAKSVNWEMDPGKITYLSILKNTSALPGLLPIGPKYSLNFQIIKGAVNIGRSIASISRAIGI